MLSSDFMPLVTSPASWGRSWVYREGLQKSNSQSLEYLGGLGACSPEHFKVLVLRYALYSILERKPKGFHYCNLSKFFAPK